MTQELIERLRAYGSAFVLVVGEEWRGEAYIEAADTIASLQARVAELEGALDECSGALSNIPAPHDWKLWTRICNAIKRAHTTLGQPNGQG